MIRPIHFGILMADDGKPYNPTFREKDSTLVDDNIFHQI